MSRFRGPKTYKIKEIKYENDPKLRRYVEISSVDSKYASYDAKIYTSVDGGKRYYYCGNGKFCKTYSEALLFKKQFELGLI